MRIAERTKGAILLATDFSKPARRAYPYALALASVLKSRLILLHVVNAPPGFETWSPSARRFLGPLKTKALLELGRMVRTAEDSGVRTQYKLVVSIPEDAILKIAKESRSDLIAMGTHGRTGWDRLQLGSTAETILRQAPCPVLTVHAAIAADGVSHGAGRRLEKIASASQADQVISGRIVMPGDPVEVILDQAKRVRADLIVMGTNGRRGVQRLVLGSVAECVVRRAGCPVLVVKERWKQ